jgi:Asp-tRNA(Asn)/Glu-tRNA(Gln) amidotransferase C subunit
MDKFDKEHLEQLIKDMSKVMSIIEKLGEADVEQVDSIKEELKLTRDEIKERYGKEDTPETNPS